MNALTSECGFSRVGNGEPHRFPDPYTRHAEIEPLLEGLLLQGGVRFVYNLDDDAILTDRNCLAITGVKVA